MKKITVFLCALMACVCAVAAPTKAPARSNVFNSLPSGYVALGTNANPNHIYYSTRQQYAIPIGDVNGVSIIGEVDGKYYSTTYAYDESDGGAGFIAAMKVDDNAAVMCNCQNGTTSNYINLSVRVEPAGEYAARIVYTLTHQTGLLNWSSSRTVSLGVWADIMIGDNDRAPIYRLLNEQGKVYGLDMKYKSEEDAAEGEKIPVFTALFGQGVTGVTPIDDYWFGQYRNNYNASEIVGNYDNLCDIQHGSGSSATIDYNVLDEFFMTEGGNYDSGMGFCWKNITIPRGESVELSFIVSASEIDIEEPEPEPDPEEEYNVEVYDTPDWNTLAADHPAHVWGYYKHPFGLTGHMEFMVDGDRGTGEWTAIEGDMASDAEFDLNFNLNFDPDVADYHTLKLRINDGLGNYRYLDDLTQRWEDVRHIDLTVDPVTQAYDGTPKSFEICVGGEFYYTYVYYEPGTYDFSIVGDYDKGTIGENTVLFFIKYQPVLNVVVPDDCLYDGEEHPATYTYNGDGNVIVTYKDTETGDISTEAPVEPGTYEVFVEVTETVNYLGIDNTSYGTFTIGKLPSEIDGTVPADCDYDGQHHAATVVLVKGDGTMTVTYVNAVTGETSTEAPVVPGTYNVVVTVTETDHYNGLEQTIGTFTIDKARAEIEFVEIPEEVVEYDEKPHGVVVVLKVGDTEPVVTYYQVDDEGNRHEIDGAPVQEGVYIVVVTVAESDFYYGVTEEVGPYQIKNSTSVMELNAANEDNAAWYTIDGRRVAAPTERGIYIHNGKKYIVK